MRLLAALVFGRMRDRNTPTPDFYSPAAPDKLRLTETIETGSRTPVFIDPND
jgi:hypothetical protein